MIEIVIERAYFGAVKRDHWRASWFDRELGQFVGGSGGSPWKAVQWALVDREETRLGLTPILSRSSKDTPKSVLARLPTQPKPTHHKLEVVPQPKKSAASRRTQTKRKSRAT